MSEQIFSKITEYIDAIAMNLGVATEYVYEIMTKQMFLEGMIYSILLPLFLLTLGIIEYKLIRYTLNYKAIDDELLIIASIMVGIILIVVIVVNIFMLPESIMKIFNPEYYVVKEILGIFK